MSEVEQELDYHIVEIDTSMYPSGTNPSALGWWENDPEDFTELFKRPTSDTSIVSGKSYYELPSSAIVDSEYMDAWQEQYNKQQGGIRMSEAAIAYSTYQTYLMYRTTTSGSYTKLIDIKDYPDLRQTPNLIDVTTLSHNSEKQIPGIIRMGDGYGFTANYTKENFQLVKGLEGHQYDYAVYFGGTTAGVPDGNQGVISWTGDVFAAIVGKGVDDAREMTVNCYPSTDPAWTDSPT